MHLAAKGEVEAQALGGDVGALLGHLVPQHLAQGGVEQVGGGVELGGLLAVVGQTALEALLGARVAGGLVLLEAFLKGGHVHGEAALPGQLAGHLNGEAIGIVQVEGAYAVNDAILHPGSHLVKLLVALAQGAGEAELLQLKLFQHKGAVPGQLRINVLVLGDDNPGNFAGEAFGHVQLHAVAHSPADQPAQHIALVQCWRGLRRGRRPG